MPRSGLYLRIEDINLISAAVVPAGDDLPEYCRVLGYVRPAINFEIRLPTSAWNSALIHEIESVEMRDRYFPSPHQAIDLWERHTEGFEEISAELDELVSAYLEEKYTDYYYVVGN